MERPRLTAPSIGNPRPPRPPMIAQRPPRSVSSPAGAGDDPDGDGREPWSPGRGATRKTGNGKRAPKR
jgi:hypothetical protein